MQTPNGYSWLSEPWLSTGALVDRMNFAVTFSNNRFNGVSTDWRALIGPVDGAAPDEVGLSGESVSDKEAHLETFLLGQQASDKTRTTVLSQVANEPAQEQAEKSFGIKAGEPEPMWALLNARTGKPVPPVDRQAAEISALLLGSPEFQRR
jgi:hypothetical protein